MGKKHKKKKSSQADILLNVNTRSKKKLNKDFKKALDDIEEFRIQMYEADKKSAKELIEKRLIKKKQSSLQIWILLSVEKKISKKWEKTGFMDHLVVLLKEVSPFVQLLAKALASLITLFLSIPFVKEHISPNMVSKLSTVFDLAMAM